MYFESHAHYDDRRFDGDRAAALAAARATGVDYIINVGEAMKTSRRSIELAEEYDFIYAAVGVHPHNAKELTDGDLDKLRQLAKHKKVVAIGEIGLDFYYDNSPRDVQERRFRQQLELCKETGLPVIIHSREADQLTYDIIKESGVSRGVIHCYSGSPEMALQYVELGFMIGVGGVITYKNAKRLVETLRILPETSFLAETDCPYLSPEPKRGSRNTSEYLPFIVAKIGQIRQISLEEAAEITFKNAASLFGVK